MLVRVRVKILRADTLLAYTATVRHGLMTVLETPSFQREAAALLTGAEHAELIGFLAANPEAGNIIPGPGGVRKLRWAAGGKGKRGGTRVIYYYHNESVPLFLLHVYGKSEKDNLLKAELNEMRRLVPRLVSGYQRRRKK